MHEAEKKKHFRNGLLTVCGISIFYLNGKQNLHFVDDWDFVTCKTCIKIQSNKKMCFNCRFYSPGYDQTYEEPGMSPECEHDTSWICQFSAWFPFENGCKNHEFRTYGKGNK